MDFSTFLKNRITTKGLNSYTFGSLSMSAEEQLKNVSLFSSATSEQLNSLDLAALMKAEEAAKVVGSDASSDTKALAEVVKSLMELEGVQTAADADGDGKINATEAKAFLQGIMGNDGDATNISMTDIDNALSKMGIDLAKVAEDTVAEALKDTPETAETESTGGTSSSSGGSFTPKTSNTNTDNTTTTTATTPEEIEAKIKEQEEVKAGYKTKIDEAIAEQDKIIDDAMKEENSGITPEVQAEYNSQKALIDADIKTKDGEIEEQKGIVQDKTSAIEGAKQSISSLTGQKDSLSSQLSSIAADDEDGASKKADIESKISNLEGEIKAKEDEQKAAEDAKKAAEDKQKELKDAKTKLEADRDGLLEKLAKENNLKINPETQAKIDAAKTEIQEIRSEGDEAVADADSKIQELKTQLEQAKQKEETDKLIKENSVAGGDDTADLALGYDGKSAAEMKQIMQEKGYQFDDGAWCADFVSFALSQSRGEDDLPDWYKNCGNRAYCPTIEDAANNAGAVVSSSEAQVGDAVTFTRNGRSGHIGIITAIDDDGTIHTVEGNTSDDNGSYTSGVVNEHTYSPDEIRAFISMKK